MWSAAKPDSLITLRNLDDNNLSCCWWPPADDKPFSTNCPAIVCPRIDWGRCLLLLDSNLCFLDMAGTWRCCISEASTKLSRCKTSRTAQIITKCVAQKMAIECVYQTKRPNLGLRQCETDSVHNSEQNLTCYNVSLQQGAHHRLLIDGVLAVIVKGGTFNFQLFSFQWLLLYAT